MLQEQIYLTLGCYGREEDKFVLCPSCSNRILLLEDSLENIEEIWAYLEAIQLLDRPMINLNAIRNTVYRMQEKYDQKFKKLWSEKDFNIIERFIHMHKPCGLYLKLEVSDNEPALDLIKVEQPIQIKAKR